MNRLISGITVGVLVLAGGVSNASASTTPTIVLSGASAVYGVGIGTIVATTSVAGFVKFAASGVVISGCEATATTPVTPFIAKCVWTPNAPGAMALTGTFTPSDAVNFTAADSPTFNVKVGLPVQGADPISPIHMYVDTVVASGAIGVLAPKFGTGCSIVSEFIVGQTIVFRVYANDSDLGGAAMDPRNTATAFITIPGLTDPLPMSYGNHGGVAFWVGVLKTGTAPGFYNTLGVLNFKVTMIAKDLTQLQQLAYHRVASTVNKKHVVTLVPYYRTVSVYPAMKGAVGTWQSNFTPVSQVTINAVPTS
jgi:hypothetical protein